MVILENIDIDIDINKAILQNIDIDKISNRFKFGISNRANCAPWFKKPSISQYLWDTLFMFLILANFRETPLKKFSLQMSVIWQPQTRVRGNC